MKSLPASKSVCDVVRAVQTMMGFTTGLYLFTSGALFYDAFRSVSTEKTAIFYTSLSLAIGLGFQLLLEVPTGALGDTLGRKRTVLVSVLFRGVWFLCLAIIPFLASFSGVLCSLITALFVFSVSYTLFSGTFTAWCVDAWKEADPEAGVQKLLARGYTYNFLAQAAGGMLGVLLFTRGLAPIGFGMAALSCVACAMYCAPRMKEQRRASTSSAATRLRRALEDVRTTVTTAFGVFRCSPVIRVLSVVFAAYMALQNVVDHFWPVFLKSRVSGSLTLMWMLSVAAVLLACAAGSRLLDFLCDGKSDTPQPLLQRLFLRSAVLAAAPILMLAWQCSRGPVSFAVFLGAILCPMIAYGILTPLFEVIINSHIPASNASERSTVLSFANMLRSLVVLIIAVPSGGASGATSAIGWAVPATLLLASTAIARVTLARAPKPRIAPKVIGPSGRR